MRGIARGAAQVLRSWREARLSKIAVGKYVIVFASAVHVGWAILLGICACAGAATPVAILVNVFGGRYRAAAVLVAVAAAAMVYPFLGYRISTRKMAGLLLPQQIVLVMSAGAGIAAAWAGRYADGVARSWPFILADQLPIIVLALLYTLVLIEVSGESSTELVTEPQALSDPGAE